MGDKNYKRLYPNRGRPPLYSTRIPGIAVTEAQAAAIQRWVTVSGGTISEQLRQCIQLRMDAESARTPCDED